MVCEYDHHPHQGRCRMWAGKPRLTCENGPKHPFDSGTLASENETGPGAVDAASRPLATGPTRRTDDRG